MGASSGAAFTGGCTVFTKGRRHVSVAQAVWPTAVLCPPLALELEPMAVASLADAFAYEPNADAVGAPAEALSPY